MSEVSKPRQKAHVLEFISRNSFVFSGDTLIDIHRGIHRTAKTNPQKAFELRDWLLSVSSDWPLVSGREQQKAKVLAAMLECRQLKTLWLPNPRAAHPSFGYHVAIAATAIAYDLPLAGFGIDTFLRIDRRFEIPGLYDLKSQSWRSASKESLTVDWGSVAAQLHGASISERRATLKKNEVARPFSD